MSQEIFDQVAEQYKQRIAFLSAEIKVLEQSDQDVSFMIEAAAELLARLDGRYKQADLDTKQKLLGSIFPEKLIFDGTNYRTASPSPLISSIQAGMAVFGTKNHKKSLSKNGETSMVIRSGLEPETPCLEGSGKVNLYELI